MAEEIVCPVCDTVNAASNETCVECGADLSSQMAVEHDDPSIADTPAGGSDFMEDEADFDAPDEYAAQDFHDDPGDVEIEGSPSEQIVNQESDDDFEDEFAEFGDSDDVDEGEFPLDDEEFGDEEDLYEEAATEQEMQAMGVAEGEESHADELAQEAADEYVEDDFDDFEEDEDPYAEFEDDDSDDFGDLADEDSDEDEFAEFEDADAFDDEDDFEDLADEASEELEQDEFAEFEEEDSDVFDAEALAEPSEPEPEEPPELAVILNPQREGAEDLAGLPEPGPYTEPATLTLFSDRHHVGDLAVSANILTLGLTPASDDADEADADVEDAPELEESYDDPGTMELEDELIEEVEADPLDDEELYSEDISLQGGEAPAEFEADEDDVEDEFADFEDEPSEAEMSDASEASDISEASEVSEVDHDGEPVLVDLGQYADADAFAGKHSYIFRQNKNYTLYVTSDAGTQLNDEMLDLGEHRELEDGDIIVLGGELAMRFNLPASA